MPVHEELRPESPPAKADAPQPGLEKATFGAGCFWCVEAVFQELKGVHGVVSGYSGGTTKNPTYEQVCSGSTGHAEVIQIESAMGAAIEIFEGARTIEVGRDRYVPVKTTNDLLVLRSDVYDIGPDFVLDQAADMVPFVDLDGVYKLVGDFDKRFKAGAPSLRKATSFVVNGDWDFGPDVTVVGTATLEGERGRVEAGSVLGS